MNTASQEDLPEQVPEMPPESISSTTANSGIEPVDESTDATPIDGGDSKEIVGKTPLEAEFAAQITSSGAVSTPVNLSVNLEPGMRLRITIEALPIDGSGKIPESGQTVYLDANKDPQSGAVAISLPADLPGGKAARRRFSLSQVALNLRQSLRAWPYSLAMTLFGLSLFIYLAVRLIGLNDFPIYFFSDEAIQTNLAADFVHENFTNASGEFLPTYFFNVDKYSLSTTVYLQVLPYLIFGKSEFVTRATAVLVTLLAAVCIGLILRDIFKLPYWWSATLLLSMAPAWFLHSRTAFETTAMVSFYTGGLYFYMLYRYRSPRYLYASLVLFALAFYSYNPGQVVVTLTGILLFLSDVRYHWQNRRTAMFGLGLLFLLALPFLRFRLEHPTAMHDHLVTLGSYWIRPVSLQEKLTRFAREYIHGLSPGYWFTPNQEELVRHLMKGYGFLHRITLIFAVVGMGVLLSDLRSSANRAVLIAFIAAPSGAAVAGMAVTRALVMVIPATLMIAVGVITLLKWLGRVVRRLSPEIVSVSLFGVLSLVNVFMTWDALHNGPTWYTEYGLGGLQYGGAQLFGEIKEYLQEKPDVQLVVSPSWANSADVIARFFLGDPIPFKLGSIDDYLVQHLDLNSNMAFVMIPEEYERATSSGKFENIQVERTVPYPDGQTGFYFVRLNYVENVDEIMSAEREARKKLQEGEIVLDGQLVKIRYPILDMGRIDDLWDGSENSVARTFEANPFRLEMVFPVVRSLNGFDIVIGDTDVKIVAQVFAEDDPQPVEYVAEMSGSVQKPRVTFNFGKTVTAKELHLEVWDLHQNEPGHVHIWEIVFH
jgi:4-amino-4-deoxy-L-arabinose transferase-like glycosyltransferase